MYKKHFFLKKQLELKKGVPASIKTPHTFPVDHTVFHIQITATKRAKDHRVQITASHNGSTITEIETFDGLETQRVLKPNYPIIADTIEIISLNEDMRIILQCELLGHGFF